MKPKPNLYEVTWRCRSAIGASGVRSVWALDADEAEAKIERRLTNSGVHPNDIEVLRVRQVKEAKHVR